MAVIFFCSLAATAMGNTLPYKCNQDTVTGADHYGPSYKWKKQNEQPSLKSIRAFDCSYVDISLSGVYQCINGFTAGGMYCKPSTEEACKAIHGRKWADNNCYCDKDGNVPMSDKYTCAAISEDTSINIAKLMMQFMWLYQLILIVVGVVILMIAI